MWDSAWLLLHRRQPDGELAALSKSFAGSRHLPPCISIEPFDEGQPQTQPAPRTIQAAVALGKRLEQPRQHVRLDADAGVPNRHDSLDAFPRSSPAGATPCRRRR